MTLKKSFYKLGNNFVYGQALRNVRKQQNIMLITNEKMVNKYLSKPCFINNRYLMKTLLQFT